jgi:hypothetical protein
VRIDHPTEGDTSRTQPESRAVDTLPAAKYEPPDRVAIAADYRATVDAAYRNYYQSLTAGTAGRKSHEARFEHADADPLRSLGSASETHPAELEAAMERLDGAGVEVDIRHGSMSYSPSAVAGQPGRIILDPEASYGAVLHEMSHFSDDEAASYPGLRYWLEDPGVTAAGESRAYGVEIDYANSIGETEIASQLEKLKADRISQLQGDDNEQSA